jgi:hypothetical protein
VPPLAHGGTTQGRNSRPQRVPNEDNSVDKEIFSARRAHRACAPCDARVVLGLAAFHYCAPNAPGVVVDSAVDRAASAFCIGLCAHAQSSFSAWPAARHGRPAATRLKHVVNRKVSNFVTETRRAANANHHGGSVKRRQSLRLVGLCSECRHLHFGGCTMLLG